ncbi:MAG: hypothetical protein LBC10_00995 [Deltaproteobacteria bacterium]|jgi:hypothetical protein|nr:hypothetical protein [Deltaproteobacteria bacterium]
MSSSEKCNLLLMRDDGRTLRWRIGLRFFRTLCFMAALLPLLLGGAGWLAWYLYEDNTALNAQLRRLEQENKIVSAALKRLANLELLLNMPDSAKLLALQNQQAKIKAAEHSAPPPEVPPKENIKEQNQGDAISLEATPPPQSPSAPSVDMRLIGVENVHARRLGNSLRIALDLVNSQQKNQLAGYVSCTLKSAGSESNLLEIPRDVSSFRINRFKRAVLAPTLPAAMRNLPTLTVLIEINLEERGVVYRNEYPVENAP